MLASGSCPDVWGNGNSRSFRRSDRQADTQQLILDYIADNSCDVVGLGDTRLGDDSSELTKMARGVQVRVAREREAVARANATGGDEAPNRGTGKPDKVQWTSAGSHKDENDVWRGGVALGSYGAAVLRQYALLEDCRGWGRYQGRIYQGKGGKRMVVVVMYAPDAQYDEGSSRGDYSQRLGERAKAVGQGATSDKWKPGASPPKPTAEQVKHPKRLLWADLTMHFRHYAYCKKNDLGPDG